MTNKYIEQKESLILFESTDYGLIKVRVTDKEFLMAKRMVGLLGRLLPPAGDSRVCLTRYESDTFGQCELREYYRGRNWHTVLRLSTMVGDKAPYEYGEVRLFLCLAIQLMCGEYPAIDYSLWGEEAHWVLGNGERFTRTVNRG